MPQELSSAERLLQRKLQQFYKTGEVLEPEFRLIRGQYRLLQTWFLRDGGAR
jgi:hypothetical protein